MMQNRCIVCGAPIKPNQRFCSKECRNYYRPIWNKCQKISKRIEDLKAEIKRKQELITTYEKLLNKLLYPEKPIKEW